MSSRNNISHTARFTRRVAACALACALVLTALVSVPALAAEANVGTTLMGLRVWDSSKNQSSGTDGQPGSIKVGLRVSNSNSTEPVKVRVTFMGNQGKWNQADSYAVNVVLFEPTLAPSTKPERVGYELDGWSFTPDGAAVSLPTSTVEAATYYARWKPKNYTISYTLGDGTNSASNPATYDVTKSITLADATPPTGYQFDGWTCEQLNITQAAKNPKILAGTAKDLTFVAHFSPAKYKVTFDSKGGSGVDPQEVEYGATVTKPTDPTRGGYEFVAWYKDEGLTIPWNFNTDTMPADVMTLYAKWSEHIVCDVPIPVTLTVDAAGQVSEVLQNGESYKFVSGTTAPIVVTSATSALLAGANTLFPDEAARKDVAILIKPSGGQQTSIPLPATTPVSLGFQIETKGTLPVSFGLYLPDTARLNYLANDGTAEIASISYTVSLATS